VLVIKSRAGKWSRDPILARRVSEPSGPCNPCVADQLGSVLNSRVTSL
jgi:hypothetical protein